MVSTKVPWLSLLVVAILIGGIARQAYACCVFVAYSSGADAISDVDEAVSLHDANWQAIYAFDAEFNQTWRFRSSAAPIPDQSQPVQWKVVGERQRLAIFSSRKDSEVLCETWQIDETSVQYLTHPKEVDLGSLSKCDKKGVSAVLDPVTPLLLSVRAPQVLRHINLMVTRPLLLRELCERWKVQVISTEINDGADILMQLKADYPAAAGDERSGSWMDIYINKSKGYLIHKIDYFDMAAGREPADLKKPVPVAFTHAITRYHDCGNGVFYPASVKFANLGRFDPKAPKSGPAEVEIEWVSTKLAVNSSDLQIAGSIFPDGAVVEDNRGPKTAIHIWGADGAPTQTFASAEEFDKYNCELCEQIVPPSNRPTFAGYLFRTLLAVVSLAVICGLAIYRYRRKLG